MKKAIVAVLFVVAGLLAYNFATTGELTLVPSFALSEDERQLKDLEARFKAARKEFAGAHRTAAVSGIDMTADAEAARRARERFGAHFGQHPGGGPGGFSGRTDPSALGRPMDTRCSPPRAASTKSRVIEVRRSGPRVGRTRCGGAPPWGERAPP